MAAKNNARQENRELSEDLKIQREKDRQMVRGRFMFHEVPGGTTSFPFRKYKGDPIENWTFHDGDVYTIPLGVAKHLNANCWYPIHAYSQGEKGATEVRIGQKVRRYSFQSLEFTDVEGVPQVGSAVNTQSSL